jgi:hypothetical protein
MDMVESLLSLGLMVISCLEGCVNWLSSDDEDDDRRKARGSVL